MKLIGFSSFPRMARKPAINGTNTFCFALISADKI